jgi:NAD(P)-dependent dehydrogenase (short-subunit alcohol dehydrogenase family)
LIEVSTVRAVRTPPDASVAEGLPAFSLTGRRIAVTGASRGIGAAAATAVASAGAHVILGVRDPHATSELVETISAQAIGTVEVRHLDVTSASSVQAYFEEIGHDGPLDGLVNNAGITRSNPARDTSERDWHAIMDVNLTGVFRCSRAFLAVASDDSAIVNVASFAASVGVSSEAAYCASKGGVVAFTHALALENARHGVRVNAIAPGYVDTDMPRAALQADQIRARIVGQIPLRRIADPREIGAPIAFLLSPAASYITGTTLFVDGGLTAR